MAGSKVDGSGSGGTYIPYTDTTGTTSGGEVRTGATSGTNPEVMTDEDTLVRGRGGRGGSDALGGSGRTRGTEGLRSTGEVRRTGGELEVDVHAPAALEHAFYASHPRMRETHRTHLEGATFVNAQPGDSWSTLALQHYRAHMPAGAEPSPEAVAVLARVLSRLNGEFGDGAPTGVIALPSETKMTLILTDMVGRMEQLKRERAEHQPTAAATQHPGYAQQATSTPTEGRKYVPGMDDNLRQVVLAAYGHTFEQLIPPQPDETPEQRATREADNAGRRERAEHQLRVMMMVVADLNGLRSGALGGVSEIVLPTATEMSAVLTARGTDGQLVMSEDNIRQRYGASTLFQWIDGASRSPHRTLAKLQSGELVVRTPPATGPGEPSRAEQALVEAQSLLNGARQMQNFEAALANPGVVAFVPFFALDFMLREASFQAHQPASRSELLERREGESNEDFVNRTRPALLIEDPGLHAAATENPLVLDLLAASSPEKMREAQEWAHVDFGRAADQRGLKKDGEGFLIERAAEALGLTLPREPGETFSAWSNRAIRARETDGQPLSQAERGHLQNLAAAWAGYRMPDAPKFYGLTNPRAEGASSNEIMKLYKGANSAEYLEASADSSTGWGEFWRSAASGEARSIAPEQKPDRSARTRQDDEARDTVKAKHVAALQGEEQADLVREGADKVAYRNDRIDAEDAERMSPDGAGRRFDPGPRTGKT